ncbi:hypothetical protein PCANC_01510 [Puccinia coronata f. sp. avenae]|uniref:Secreted protein n=1 Tax=Puccinia coronata f. sp. avenae TaxID=200324 RepID=A0A2N5W304_9BASI|nr:hypothetical protein PCANC_01510 [Puccinia coronata f. sp. avenae]
MPGPSLRRILVALAILAPSCWAGTSLVSRYTCLLGRYQLGEQVYLFAGLVPACKANATVTPLLLLTDVCLVQVEHLKQQSKEGEAVLSKLHTHS